MRELELRKPEAETKEYIHLISREGRIFERRKFVEGLVERLSPVNSGRKNSDVVLSEKIIRFEHQGTNYKVLAVEKGHYVKEKDWRIGMRYVEVPGIIVSERAKKMSTKDGMEFEVSEVKPVPYNFEIRNRIKDGILEFKMVDRDNADKNIHYW